MNKRSLRFLGLLSCVVAITAITTIALSKEGESKDYPEGSAATQNEFIDAPGTDNKRPYAEGQGGIDNKLLEPSVVNDLVIRYMFSGVTDDGLKGNNGKKATSILCTNTGNVNNTIQVKLYQYNGVNIHSTSLTASPLNSYTFSTQPTAIYFDDAIFGAGGADAIYQGFAQILSDNPSIVCTAQVLDPWGYPPAYMDKLTLHNADGSIVGATRKIFLPMLTRQ